MKSANFGFLVAHDARLVTLGGLLERYFRGDPSTAIVELRQFAELTAKMIVAYRDERETFKERLRRLSYERVILKEVIDVFHTLLERQSGKRSGSEGKTDSQDQFAF
ncbi:hypothetical protein [Hyphomicrobium sp.]|uniref:hypothetical protein n=1 Tax=Hyphomicrobium sp. TaxID=82 RepID=UPI0025BEBB60|nr:hypothetical protein [Hyphomicrobium sp.]